MNVILPDGNNLFELIAGGNEQAFRQIFHEYNAKLYPFVLKVTRSHLVSEDIVQETFLRLWVHRSEVALMERPASWLYRVASNLSLTFLRSQASEIRRLQRIASPDAIGQDEVLEHISLKEMQELLSKAIEQLPPKRQYIYKLSREQGLSYKEIAEKLQISPNTVKNQLISAFRSIKNYLAQVS